MERENEKKVMIFVFRKKNVGKEDKHIKIEADFRILHMNNILRQGLCAGKRLK